MTTGFHFEVSFRIAHPYVNPAEITQALSIEPSHSYKVGDERRTPKGYPLPGINKRSSWIYALPIKADALLPDVLGEINKRLFSGTSYLERLRDTGGTLEYFIGWFSEFNSGEVLDWKLLRECSELRIDLAFDVYSVDQREADTD